jgi:hypothetical protein
MSHLPPRIPGSCIILCSVSTELAGQRASGVDTVSLVCWVGWDGMGRALALWISTTLVIIHIDDGDGLIRREGIVTIMEHHGGILVEDWCRLVCR